MKQLKSFMVLNIGGGDRITYTYDEVDSDTGEPKSKNNKENFYAVAPELQSHIEAIREFIVMNKLKGD